MLVTSELERNAGEGKRNSKVTEISKEEEELYPLFFVLIFAQILRRMYKLLKPIFFKFDPESVHHFVFKMMKVSLNTPIVKSIFKSAYTLEDKRLEREVFGLKFKNPVGLAAGFDKDAKLLNELENLGFGFIELGTVTPEAQEGNPRKRLFRLIGDEAIINRMGFNNQGVKAMVEKLKQRNTNIVVGGNIGKMTASTPDQYTGDYMECFTALHPYVDYFTVNVSCPNVGSHAKLQDKDYLVELLNTLQDYNKKQKKVKPILLKIAPDLNKIQLDEMVELVGETKIDGIIASNTSTNREGLKANNLDEIGNGGLSGKPLTKRSTEVIRYLSEKSNGSFPIIGVGGIQSAKDALDKLEAGASLVQVYTGYIYRGPALVKEINKAILKSNK